MGEPLGVVGSPSLPPPGRRALAHVFSVEKKVIADDDIGDSSVGGLPRVESTSAVEFEGIDLPGLSSRSTTAYRHTSHGLQKQELTRTESAAMRELARTESAGKRGSAAEDVVGRREAAAADHLGHMINQISAPASDAEETKLEDTEAKHKQQPAPRSQKTNKRKSPSQSQHKKKLGVVTPLHLASAGGANANTVGAASRSSPHAAGGGSPHIATTSLMPSLGKGWNSIAAARSAAAAAAPPLKLDGGPDGQKRQQPATSATAGTAGNGSGSTGGKPKKRKRVVKPRDPNKPTPKPWGEAEIALLKQMVVSEGPGDWEGKAARLGSGRTAKALHTRWLRDEGRIVDRPRKVAASDQDQDQDQQEAEGGALSSSGSSSSGSLSTEEDSQQLEASAVAVS